MVQSRHRAIAASVAARGKTDGHALSNTVMIAFGAIFNHTMESVPNLTNPIRRLRKQWYPTVRRTRLLTGDQLPVFWTAVCGLKNSIHRDLLKLLMFTDMRRSEAANLLWSEVDFASGLLRIGAARMKSRKPFTLPMNSFVRDLLVARRAQGIGLRVAPVGPWSNSPSGPG